MNKTVTWIKREELHEQVQATPLTKLATKYGISDNGLRKICKKLQVPLPGKGYHLRSNKTKATLPPFKGQAPQAYALRKVAKVPLQEDLASSVKVAFERLASNRIKVPTTLCELRHRLLISTQTVLNEKTADRFGRISARSPENVDISVYPHSVDRALQIMNALVEALESQGYPVKADPDGKTYVMLNGETIDMRLEEKAKQVRHVPTQEEVERTWCSPACYDYLPTGQLSIRISAPLGGTKSFSDGKKGRLEDMLNQVIFELVRFSLEEQQRKAAFGRS